MNTDNTKAQKNIFIAYILLILVGFLGAHKFYLRRYKTAIFYIALFICSQLFWSSLWIIFLLVVLVLDLTTLPKQCKGFFCLEESFKEGERQNKIEAAKTPEQKQAEKEQKKREKELIKKEKKEEDRKKQDFELNQLLIDTGEDIPWEDHPATDRQKEYLDENDISYSPYITKGQASKIIDKLKQKEKIEAFTVSDTDISIPDGVISPDYKPTEKKERTELASQKQLDFLKKLGYPTKNKDYTKDEAIMLIGSRLPAEQEDEEILKFFKVKYRKMNQAKSRELINAIFASYDNKEKWNNRPINSEQKKLYDFFDIPISPKLKFIQAKEFIDEFFKDKKKHDFWDSLDFILSDIKTFRELNDFTSNVDKKLIIKIAKEIYIDYSNKLYEGFDLENEIKTKVVNYGIY